MKRRSLSPCPSPPLRWLLIFPLLSLLAACSLETSDNGDLDGQWHIEQIDTTSTSGSLDLSGQRRFWAFQTDLMTTTDYDKGGLYVMRFSHSGKTLRVYDIHIDNRMEGDPAVEDASLMAPFGINSLDETFQVESLSGTRMVVSTDQLRIRLRKL